MNIKSFSNIRSLFFENKGLKQTIFKNTFWLSLSEGITMILKLFLIVYVGGALRNWLEKEKYPLFLYDKYKKIGSIEEVNDANIIFVCVLTPFNKDGKGYDSSAVSDTLGIIKGSKDIVIRSTILPGSTEEFQKEFPQHRVLFNPEFLRAKTAIEGFLNSKRQIIRATEQSKDSAQKILDLLPKAPYQKIIPSSEAEMVKYFSNTFLASKVIFANQIYDLCHALSINMI